jgi:hypothetical protein
VLLFGNAVEVAIVSLKIGVVAAVIMVAQEVSVVIGINVITKEIASRSVAWMIVSNMPCRCISAGNVHIHCTRIVVVLLVISNGLSSYPIRIVVIPWEIAGWDPAGGLLQGANVHARLSMTMQHVGGINSARDGGCVVGRI